MAETVGKIRRRWVIAGLLIVVTALPVFFAQMAPFWWFFELFTHFRPQYALGYVILAMLVLIWRTLHPSSISHDPVPLATFVLLGLSLSQIMVIFSVSAKNEVFADKSQDVRIATGDKLLSLININVLSENPQQKVVVQYLLEERPDFITLQEVTPIWLEELRRLDEAYPFSSIQVSDQRRGIAVFSRIRPEDYLLRDINRNAPSFTGTFPLANGKRLTLVSAHPRAPTSPRKALERNQVLEALPELALRWNDPARIIVGDLNLTQWSPLFLELLDQADARNSTARVLPASTWCPTVLGIPLVMLQLPIDHCLISSPVLVVRREIGPYVGSDHLPLKIDFLVVGGPFSTSSDP